MIGWKLLQSMAKMLARRSMTAPPRPNALKGQGQAPSRLDRIKPLLYDPAERRPAVRR